MTYNPKDVDNAIRLCQEHKYYLAVPRDVLGVVVPVCPKNFYMCEYAGRLIPQAGGPVCKGAMDKRILRDPKLKKKWEKFLDDKL